MRVYERRPTDEIIDEWIDRQIHDYPPFKLGYHNEWDKPRTQWNTQIVIVALILFWELVKAVRNIATDQASKIGYEMLGGRYDHIGRT